MKFTIRCGTRTPETFNIKLDDYGEAVKTDAEGSVWFNAFVLLHDTMNDDTFADDGHRNDDAVNACIALHVMGYDAAAWLDAFCKYQQQYKDRWFSSDLEKFMEHVERVAPYLSGWGPAGHESQALNKAIRA